MKDKREDLHNLKCDQVCVMCKQKKRDRCNYYKKYKSILPPTYEE